MIGSARIGDCDPPFRESFILSKLWKRFQPLPSNVDAPNESNKPFCSNETVRTMSTIEDVARAAGVGLGTASRALNGSPGVAGQTRERVLAAARELGYQRSPIARAFSRQRTNTLEILVPYLTRHFYMEVLRGVEEALADTDYSIVIRSMEHLADRDRAFAACCVRGRADGVLFVSVLPSDEVVERLELGAFPAVVVDGVRPGVSSVAVD